jgi:tetratricopeptide (TPR) repeat protein
VAVTKAADLLAQGLAAIEEDDYLRALVLLGELYAQPSSDRPASGLSYYGLCLALVEKETDRGVELCREALAANETDPAHHANLARILLAANRRREALEALEVGLSHAPDDAVLVSLRRAMGVRSRPPVPFLSRNNPLNRAIGRARHSRADGVESDERDSD